MLKALVTAAIRRARVCELANTTVVLNNIFAAAKPLPAHQYRPNILFWQLMIPSYEFSDRIHAGNISIADTANPQSNASPVDKYAAEVLYRNFSEFQSFRQPTLARGCRRSWIVPFPELHTRLRNPCSATASSGCILLGLQP